MFTIVSGFIRNPRMRTEFSLGFHQGLLLGILAGIVGVIVGIVGNLIPSVVQGLIVAAVFSIGCAVVYGRENGIGSFLGFAPSLIFFILIGWTAREFGWWPAIISMVAVLIGTEVLRAPVARVARHLSRVA